MDVAPWIWEVTIGATIVFFIFDIWHMRRMYFSVSAVRNIVMPVSETTSATIRAIENGGNATGKLKVRSYEVMVARLTRGRSLTSNPSNPWVGERANDLAHPVRPVVETDHGIASLTACTGRSPLRRRPSA